LPTEKKLQKKNKPRVDYEPRSAHGRAVNNGAASWSHILLSYLQPVGGLFLLESNFDLELFKVDIPIDGYKETLLCTWEKINCSTPNTKKTGIK